MLPCPACAAGVKAENLVRHLEGTDRDAPADAALPSRLRVDPRAATLRRRLGLGRRRVRLPATIEISPW